MKGELETQGESSQPLLFQCHLRAILLPLKIKCYFQVWLFM